MPEDERISGSPETNAESGVRATVASLEPSLPAPLLLGTRTPWGPIRAVMLTEGERYYCMSRGRGDVSMMPARLVERMVARA
jgi:hypothetical protein